MPWPRGPLLTLLLAALVLGLAAQARGPEYDEGYTAFVTGRAPRPAWPATPFRAGDMQPAFAPAARPWAIASNLRRTDVHPPLYFWTVWAWRRLWGPGLFMTRLLSVGFSLAALGAVLALAQASGLPPVSSLLITLGCFGFVETGIVARGFALAQCLQLWGLVLTLRAAEGRRLTAAGAGLLLGAASCTNYLASFPAGAAGFWLILQGGRRRAAMFLIGFAPFLAADAYFFWAQRASRIGQFPPFTPSGFLVALAHALGGAVLGGLPLYAHGAGRWGLSAGLALLLAALLLLPFWRWRHLGRPAPRLLLAGCAVATPIGLGLMGLVSHSLPVEIRYLAFALPPFALLLAGALASRPRPALWRGGLLAAQAAALAGLLLAPQTMQPEAAAARAAARAVGTEGLVLLPRGNDGVGLVSAFLTAAPADTHILLVDKQSPPARLRTILAAWPCATIARLGVDEASRATLPLLDSFAARTGKCVDGPSGPLLGSLRKP